MTSRSFGVQAAPNIPTPTDHGLVTWSFDPALAVSSASPTSGTLTLIRVPVRESRPITGVVVAIGATGVSLTSGQNLVGVYSPAGALLAQTADQTTAWGTTGVKPAALVAGVTLPAGWCWVGVLAVASGSTPAFARSGAGATTAMSSAGLTAPVSRFGIFGSSLTALPSPLTPGSVVAATNSTFWSALS
jgi:hypothetical protein